MSIRERRDPGTADTPTDIANLHIEQSGTPGSPAIVFLHGVGNSGGMWAEHMACLSSYHCLAPDLPGFGSSNHLPWVSMAHTAGVVAELIRRRVPARRAHLVGLSLGGAVTHTLLSRHPELVDRVIIDGAGALPLRSTALLNLGIAALSPLVHTRPVVSGISRAFGFDERAREDLRAASTRAFRRALSQANRVALSREEVAAPCPALLVAGEKELKAVRASNAALAHLMPASEARYVPQLGHGWLGREPELHRRMVEAWVAGSPLPAELLPETAAWSGARVRRLLGGSAVG